MKNIGEIKEAVEVLKLNNSVIVDVAKKESALKWGTTWGNSG